MNNPPLTLVPVPSNPVPVSAAQCTGTFPQTSTNQGPNQIHSTQESDAAAAQVEGLGPSVPAAFVTSCPGHGASAHPHEPPKAGAPEVNTTPRESPRL